MRRVSAKFVPCVLTVKQKEQQFLSNKNIMVCPHPPFSPDWAPCDFWLFPKVKMSMKGKRFESIQDIKAAKTAQLKTLTKEDFQNCFRKWQGRWDSVFEARGSILRGINGNVSFTVINIFLFKHSPYFFITPRIPLITVFHQSVLI